MRDRFCARDLSDDTPAICARFENVRVEHQAFFGFGPTKNHAASLAAGPWILSIDADERVDAGLLEQPHPTYPARRELGFFPQLRLAARVPRRLARALDRALRSAGDVFQALQTLCRRADASVGGVETGCLGHAHQVVDDTDTR